MDSPALRRQVRQMQDLMRKDAGVDGDAQRLAQLSWMFFLKALEHYQVEGSDTLPHSLRWNALTNQFQHECEGIVRYVNDVFIPQLKAHVESSGNENLAALFDFENYVVSDKIFFELLHEINAIPLTSTHDRDTLGSIYESLLNTLQSARNAGEFYTPRPLTRLLTKACDPKANELILDPACGTGGFLISSLQHISNTNIDYSLEHFLWGFEKKRLPHLLATTNLLLHGYMGINSICQHNPLLDRPIFDAGSVDVVLTNPPFGGEEHEINQDLFPELVATKDTATLFVQRIMELLRPGGRAAVIVPDGFLFSGGPAQKVRRELLRSFNLHTVIRLPEKVFAPYTNIKTNVLLFKKEAPQQTVRFIFQPSPEDRKTYSKTRPITDHDLAGLDALLMCDEDTNVPYIDVSIERILKNDASLNIVYDPGRSVSDITTEHSRYTEQYQRHNALAVSLQQTMRKWI